MSKRLLQDCVVVAVMSNYGIKIQHETKLLKRKA
jgi:hypothetical protein